MFALSFTSTAVTLFKRSQSVRTSTRRAVRVAVAALAVTLATAGVTFAGDHGSGGSKLSFKASNAKSLSLFAAGAQGGSPRSQFNNNKLLLSDASKNIAKSFGNSGVNNKLILSDPSKNIAKTLTKQDINRKLLLSDTSKKIGIGLLGDKGKGDKGDKGCHDDKCHKDFNWCWIRYHDDGCYHPCRHWDCYHVCEGVDLELMTLRLLDAGNPAMNVGPAFRIWLRNNSRVAIAQPFNVLLIAANDAPPSPLNPQAGVRVGFMQPGQIIAVDVRLPVQADLPGFPVLQVLVDSHREVFEVFEDNNVAVLPRTAIQPFAPMVTAAPAGGLAIAQPTSPVAGAAVSLPAAVTVNAEMPAID